GIAIDHFFVVIGPAYPAKAESHQQNHPHETVGPISPHQGADTDGDQDECTAHGRCAVLLQMRLGTISPDSLAYFQFGQPAYHPRAGAQADQQGRTTRQDGAKGNVLNDAEGAYM